MRIHGFQGLRFAAGAGEVAELAAPPFDQIDDELRDRLHASSRHQFAHLTRPLAGAEGNPYRHAAAVQRSWLESGVVARDEEASLYPYEILADDGTRRLGLCALVGLEEPESGIIRPHESTLDKPFADRLDLLRATRVDLEPVMLLTDDGGTLEPLLAEDLETRERVAEYRDEAGNLHRLFRVPEPGRIARYRQLLASCTAAIADGHHRYKVARAFARESGAPAGTAAACKLAVLFSLASKSLVIDPIHRGLEAVQDLTALQSLLRARHAVTAASGEELAAAVAAARQPALGVLTAEGAEIWELEPGRLPAGQPPGSEGLAVVHLHAYLLPALGLRPESSLDGTVLYRARPGTLHHEVRSGRLALGIFLPPMSPQAFGEAISKGDLLPAKATRFLPKLASGLVWAGHDSTLL